MVIRTNIEKKPEPKVSQKTIEGVANIYEVYQDIQINHTEKFTAKILVPSSTYLKNVVNIKRVHQKKVNKLKSK